jgi:hypothetical protein
VRSIPDALVILGALSILTVLAVQRAHRPERVSGWVNDNRNANYGSSTQKVYEKAFCHDLCQAREKQTNARKIDECLTTGRKSFIIFAEPPGAALPRDRPLHHSPSLDHVKAWLAAEIVEEVRKNSA